MLGPEMEKCQECTTPLIDVGDELVCPSCGLVKEKSTVDAAGRADPKLPLFGRQPLGSYMGARRITVEDRNSRISGNNTRYERMKMLSDFAAREGSYADCGRLIERVGEKLFLPRVVILQAASLAKKVMESPHQRRLTVAEVSAYSLVAACKIEGVTSVSIREILEAYAALGRRVSSSAVLRLAFESPVRMYARRPEEYLPRVLARLSMNRRLAGRLARDGVQQSVYLDGLRRMAAGMLGGCDQTALDGKRPCALAAAAVYSAEKAMAALEGRGLRITQRECAECGDAAEYTIREQCATVFAPSVTKLTSRAQQPLLPRTAR
jgi:transcription initiation factor TFIIIB Brf1 subunit/transcription initiation factor TFIIB